MITLIGEQLYQWDLGRQVKVSQTVKEVHFYNCNCDNAYVVETTTVDGVTTALIPNILLQESRNIYACPVENDVTLCRCVLLVNDRQKPADYVYTETELKRYEALEERIKNLEENGTGGGSVSDEQIKEAVDEALTEAKESGEFDGADGYTPQKGIDYFTEEDKEELVEEVLENIPSGGGGSGSGSEYPKKIFEYEWKDNYDKVNVTAIDFENGILTLDSMPSQITDNFDTTVRIFPILLIEGQQTFEYGLVPKEIMSTGDFYYAIKVGENQIKLQRNTTVLEVLTDSGEIDLTRWQFYVEKTRNKTQSEATVENLEIGHKYRVRLYLPHSSHFTAGINLKDEKDINYGSQYNRGFSSKTVGIHPIKMDAYIPTSTSHYETISLRSVVSDIENACLKFPRVFLADITTVNENVNFVESVISYFAPLNAINSLTPNSKFVNLNLKYTIYTPRKIAKIGATNGTGKYILDGAKFEVWDYGEVI